MKPDPFPFVIIRDKRTGIEYKLPKIVPAPPFKPRDRRKGNKYA